MNLSKNIQEMKLSISQNGISFIQKLKEEKVEFERNNKEQNSKDSMSDVTDKGKNDKEHKSPFNPRLLPSPNMGLIRGVGVDARLVRRSGIKFTTPKLSRLPTTQIQKISKSSFNHKKKPKKKSSLLKFANYMNSTIQNRRRRALMVKPKKLEPYAILKDTASAFKPSNIFLQTKKKAIMKKVGVKRELSQIEKSIKIETSKLEEGDKEGSSDSHSKEGEQSSLNLGRILSVNSGSRLEKMMPNIKLDRFLEFQRKVKVYNNKSKNIHNHHDFYDQIRSIEKLKKLRTEHENKTAVHKRYQKCIRRKMKKRYEEINGIRRVKSLRDSIVSVDRKINEKLLDMSKVIKSNNKTNGLYQEWKRTQLSARESFVKLQSNIGYQKLPRKRKKRVRNNGGSLPIFERKGTVRNRLKKKHTLAESSIIGAMSSKQFL